MRTDSISSKAVNHSIAPARPPKGSQLWPVDIYPDIHITTLGLERDEDARRLLRRALRDCGVPCRRYGWQVETVCEMDPGEKEVGYSAKDGTLYVKVRDPSRTTGLFYSYSFILATLLHELIHMSILGHGKSFYRLFVDAATSLDIDSVTRGEVRKHIGGELLNAVCNNDARRARALLSVLPEAACCKAPGSCRQLPLEYAAHHGRVAMTKLLLEARADPDSTSFANGIPPLARAAAQGNAMTAILLLEAGAIRGRELFENVAESGKPLLAAAKTDPTSNRPVSLSKPRVPAARKSRTPIASRRSESLPTLNIRTSRGQAAKQHSLLSGSLAL
mmetsp:Transcript_350/g.769  ORF Transcript_350/g.769 Transcript_350/m.769 type:complete len:333 (+) Transcript_350:96-1094(+)